MHGTAQDNGFDVRLLMSLIDGYGVLIGALHRYECDDGRSREEYYHRNIRVKTRNGLYRCAIDLDFFFPASKHRRHVDSQGKPIDS